MSYRFVFIHGIKRISFFTGYFYGFTYRKQGKFLRKARLKCSICVAHFCHDTRDMFIFVFFFGGGGGGGTTD